MRQAPERPMDPFLPTVPPRRRLAWESLGDIRRINTWLLCICCLLAAAATIEAVILLVWASRPPHIITQDEGYLQWKTTDVFRLRPSMLRSYLESVLGKLLNVIPGDYDLRPLIDFDVAPEILAAFGGEAQAGETVRINRTMRQIYRLLDVRRITDERFPNYWAFMVRGEETVYAEQRNAEGLRVHLPQSQIVFHVAYLERHRPNPQNPWGLGLAGIRRLNAEVGAHQWTKSTELEPVLQ